MCSAPLPARSPYLRLRFGLQNGRSYTLEEVGKKFGLTRERIRQIEGQALRKLRHPAAAVNCAIISAKPVKNLSVLR